MKREEYENIRPIIKSGDILLFRGKGFLARAIQFFDSAYYNHIGVVFEANGRLFIIDSNAKGVRPDLLSYRCMEYQDIGIIRDASASSSQIKEALDIVIEQADNGIKYDFTLLLRIAVKRKTRIELRKLGKESRDICSEFVRRFTNALGRKCYNTDNWITPQDFVRLMNPDEFTTVRITDTNGVTTELIN